MSVASAGVTLVPDARTLWLSTSVICAVCGIAQLVVWFGRHTERALLVWGSSCLIGGAGSGLFAFRDSLPEVLGYPVANALITVYWVALWLGMRTFSRQPPPPAVAVAPPIVVALAFETVPWVAQDPTIRTLIVALTGTWFAIAIIVDGARDQRREPLLQRWILLGLCTLWLIPLLGRPIRCVADRDRCDLFYPDQTNAAVTALILGLTGATGVTLVLMVNERLARNLIEASASDAHTGTLNRQGMMATAERVIRERPRAAVVLMMDLDRFKDTNDRHGHAAGDRLLVAFADVARRCLPPGAALARWGGEEFCALVPGMTPRRWRRSPSGSASRTPRRRSTCPAAGRCPAPSASECPRSQTTASPPPSTARTRRSTRRSGGAVTAIT
ncbi:GGDEF domain-containing protein [Tsukamurella soli]|uniref:GGDEF domain-containing protein n=1 Tax=Tsukamurella soli TaxID=644556 RepID=UPI00361A76CB